MSGQICGIDEAGRGCLAGPLCVAGCVLQREIAGLADSKKLSEKRREELYAQIIENSRYKIIEISSAQVDEVGLSSCLRSALEQILAYFMGFSGQIIYDGNANFGVRGLQTLVKADAQIAEVSAASILAKVTRDRTMHELAQRYPQYGFAQNKGYGSRAHIAAIERYGLTPFHRASYKIKSLQPSLFD
ncbi:ribonuclease HII [uncultured Campylobacter sp.]|uniref:ribonuclease HII n=1 Tax=uncultured Campylobacter sp. TaxID=218934 RepID=UPI0028EFF5FB|nr:ribonuclease HII [uncultured Campylobacter sp.]